MKKKLFGFVLAICTAVFGLNSLLATSSISIVSEGSGPRNISSDGSTYLINAINTSASDLANGKVVLDVTIHNSQDIEVIYAFNNDTNLNAKKADIVSKINTNINTFSTKNVKQGVSYTTNTGYYMSTLSTNEVNQELNGAISEGVSNNINYLFDLIENTALNFSSSAKGKYMMLFTSTLPSLSTEEQNRLKNLITENITNRGIELVVYAIDSTDNIDTLKSIFGTNVISVSSSDYRTIDTMEVVSTSFVAKKENVNVEIILDDYIVNNFDVKDITSSKSTVLYDEANKKLIMSPTTIEENEDLKISYTLQVRSKIDSTILQIPSLRTARQVKVTFTGIGGNVVGNFPADNKIEDDICSPLIKVIEEAISNPETGVYNYVIAGACMLAVALMTLVILNNKNEFNRL